MSQQEDESYYEHKQLALQVTGVMLKIKKNLKNFKKRGREGCALKNI